MDGEAATTEATTAATNGAGEKRDGKARRVGRRVKKAIRRATKKTRGRKGRATRKFPGALCVKISGDSKARGVSMDVEVFKRFERARASVGKREGRKLSRSRAINRAISVWLKKVGF